MENSLKHNNYFGSVEFSGEDQILHGKIIGISDLVTYEGNSMEQLKNAFVEAVENYLETCKELEKSADKYFNS